MLQQIYNNVITVFEIVIKRKLRETKTDTTSYIVSVAIEYSV